MRKPKTQNNPKDNNFDDLFLTSEGKSILDYVENTYLSHEESQKMIYPYLYRYFNILQQYLNQNIEPITAKEIAYNEMVECIDESLKQ